MVGQQLIGDFEDVRIAAEFVWDVDESGEDHDVEHHVLDDGDDGRGAESAGVGVGGEDDEGCGEGPLAVDTHGSDDDADADQLESDVGHKGENAGECDGDGEPAIAVAAADEVGKGYVTVAVAYCPQAREDHHHVGVGDDGVGDGEESHSTGAVERCRDCDDGVGGVKVASDEEPGDPCAEATASEAPLFEGGHACLGSSPARGPESGEGYEQKEKTEDYQRRHMQLQSFTQL